MSFYSPMMSVLSIAASMAVLTGCGHSSKSSESPGTTGATAQITSASDNTNRCLPSYVSAPTPGTEIDISQLRSLTGVYELEVGRLYFRNHRQEGSTSGDDWRLLNYYYESGETPTVDVTTACTSLRGEPLYVNMSNSVLAKVSIANRRISVLQSISSTFSGDNRGDIDPTARLIESPVGEAARFASYAPGDVHNEEETAESHIYQLPDHRIEIRTSYIKTNSRSTLEMMAQTILRKQI